MSSTTAFCPSSRRDQRRLNSPRQAPMRVPPAQSATDSVTRSSATSTSRCLRCRVMLVRRVPNTQRVHAMAIVGDRVEEMQQHPRVAVHRAGDVAQDDQRRRAPDARAERQRRDGARRAGHAAQRRAQVDPVAARRGARAADRQFRQRQLEPRQHRPDLRQFVGGHRRKILGLQHFARRKSERRIQFDFVLVVGARLGQPSAAASPAPGATAAPAVRRVAGPADTRAAATRPPSSRAASDCARRGRTPARTATSCSCRDTSTAASASRKSVLLATPTASTAAIASITLAGPTGSPAARSTRTKCSTLSAR